jgi:sugar/nucleoside kinase (ribokinase family)
VLKSLSSAGVDVSGVVSDGGVTTTVSVVCIASSGERSFLYNPGSSSAFTLDDIPEPLVSRSDIVFAAGAMLLSSFDGKPCAELMRYARHIGKFTVMDTAWDFDGIWLDKIAPVIPYLDLFMPSVDEAAKLTGLSEPQAMADAFFKLGAKNVIIKLGKEGAKAAKLPLSRLLLKLIALSIQPEPATLFARAFWRDFPAGLASSAVQTSPTLPEPCALQPTAQATVSDR